MGAAVLCQKSVQVEPSNQPELKSVHLKGEGSPESSSTSRRMVEEPRENGVRSSDFFQMQSVMKCERSIKLVKTIARTID
nr:nucleolin 2-like isoform X7 [Biomphalaria glabrata]